MKRIPLQGKGYNAGSPVSLLDFSWEVCWIGKELLVCPTSWILRFPRNVYAFEYTNYCLVHKTLAQSRFRLVSQSYADLRLHFQHGGEEEESRTRSESHCCVQRRRKKVNINFRNVLQWYRSSFRSAFWSDISWVFYINVSFKISKTWAQFLKVPRPVRLQRSWAMNRTQCNKSWLHNPESRVPMQASPQKREHLKSEEEVVLKTAEDIINIVKDENNEKAKLANAFLLAPLQEHVPPFILAISPVYKGQNHALV